MARPLRIEYEATFEHIREQAYRRLDYLDQAVHLRDLAALRGNRLEALKGDRKGQYSIRINDQWRICFVWRDDGRYDVEIVVDERARGRNVQ